MKDCCRAALTAAADVLVEAAKVPPYALSNSAQVPWVFGVNDAQSIVRARAATPEPTCTCGGDECLRPEPVRDLAAKVADVTEAAGHWCSEAFPDADDSARQHYVCECGLPWTPGEGCSFVRGADAALRALLSEEAQR